MRSFLSLEQSADTPFAGLIPRSLGKPLVLGILVLAAGFLQPVQAETPDDQYLKILGVIERADEFYNQARTNLAIAKYTEAQTALWNLKQEAPKWNTKVVAFRLNYLSDRIQVLSKPSSPLPSDTSSSQSGESKPASASGLSSGLEIHVLEAGGEPRSILKFHPPAGQRETLDMTLTTAMSMGGGEAQSGMIVMPAMKFQLEAESQRVTDSGDMEYEMRIANVDVLAESDSLPGAAETMRASLQGLKGLAFSGLFSPQGVNHRTEAKVATDANPQMRAVAESIKESFGNAQFVLPVEAIGPGAKWEVKQKVKAQGLTIDQTNVFTLVAADGDVLNIQSSVTQGAANQAIANPMMPQMKMQLSKLSGSGNAVITIDLTKLQPKKATMNMASEMALATPGNAGTPSMKLKTETKLMMESK